MPCLTRPPRRALPPLEALARRWAPAPPLEALVEALARRWAPPDLGGVGASKVWTDRRTDRQADGRTDGRTGRQTVIRGSTFLTRAISSNAGVGAVVAPGVLVAVRFMKYLHQLIHRFWTRCFVFECRTTFILWSLLSRTRFRQEEGCTGRSTSPRCRNRIRLYRVRTPGIFLSRRCRSPTYKRRRRRRRSRSSSIGRTNRRPCHVPNRRYT